MDGRACHPCLRVAAVRRLEAALHRHFAPRDELLHVTGEQRSYPHLIVTAALCFALPPRPPLQAAYDTGKSPIRGKRVDLRQFGVLRGTAPPGDMTLLDSLTNGTRAAALTATDDVSRAAFFLEPRPAWKAELKVCREEAGANAWLILASFVPEPLPCPSPLPCSGGSSVQ